MFTPSMMLKNKYYWNNLCEIKNEIDIKRIIIERDLNVTLSPGGKRGVCVVICPTCKKVEDLIFEWDLTNGLPKRGKYT